MQWLEAIWAREGKGIPKDAPKKTGLALVLDILAREWWELVKLNLLFLLASLPLVTLPAATFATARICHRMVQDQNVYLLWDFLEALRDSVLRATLWALVSGAGLVLGIYAIVTYGAEARSALVYAVPLTVSLVATTFFAVASTYFMMFSVAGPIRLASCVRKAALAALLRPLPVMAALAIVAILWLAHVAFYPVSVFMPAAINFSFGMFAIAFGAHGALASGLAATGEDF